MKLEDYFRIWGNYEFVDGLYNVKGDIMILSNVTFEKLPVNFGKVTGSFSCADNKLTSLKGSPTHVGGDFYCFRNKLTSLEGCPTSIGGDFYCDKILRDTKEYKQFKILEKLRE